MTKSKDLLPHCAVCHQLIHPHLSRARPPPLSTTTTTTTTAHPHNHPSSHHTPTSPSPNTAGGGGGAAAASSASTSSSASCHLRCEVCDRYVHLRCALDPFLSRRLTAVPAHRVLLRQAIRKCLQSRQKRQRQQKQQQLELQQEQQQLPPTQEEEEGKQHHGRGRDRRYDYRCTGDSLALEDVLEYACSRECAVRLGYYENVYFNRALSCRLEQELSATYQNFLSQLPHTGNNPTHKRPKREQTEEATATAADLSGPLTPFHQSLCRVVYLQLRREAWERYRAAEALLSSHAVYFVPSLLNFLSPQEEVEDEEDGVTDAFFRPCPPRSPTPSASSSLALTPSPTGERATEEGPVRLPPASFFTPAPAACTAGTAALSSLAGGKMKCSHHPTVAEAQTAAEAEAEADPCAGSFEYIYKYLHDEVLAPARQADLCYTVLSDTALHQSEATPATAQAADAEEEPKRRKKQDKYDDRMALAPAPPISGRKRHRLSPDIPTARKEEEEEGEEAEADMAAEAEAEAQKILSALHLSDEPGAYAPIGSVVALPDPLLWGRNPTGLVLRLRPRPAPKQRSRHHKKTTTKGKPLPATAASDATGASEGSEREEEQETEEEEFDEGMPIYQVNETNGYVRETLEMLLENTEHATTTRVLQL